MNSSLVVCVFLVLVASVYGGSQRIVRQSGRGWGAPALTNIAEAGASEAYGAGGAIAEHTSAVSLSGDANVPAVASLGIGSNAGLDQYGSNYQSTQIGPDGSSAYQGNSASNGGYANEYLSGYLQGLGANVASSGWTAVEGEGAVAQVDGLAHDEIPSQGSGWRKP